MHFKGGRWQTGFYNAFKPGRGPHPRHRGKGILICMHCESRVEDLYLHPFMIKSTAAIVAPSLPHYYPSTTDLKNEPFLSQMRSPHAGMLALVSGSSNRAHSGLGKLIKKKALASLSILSVGQRRGNSADPSPHAPITSL